MYKPRLRRFNPRFNPRLRRFNPRLVNASELWIAIQDGFYAISTSPLDAYNLLKKQYDYYHQTF